MQGTATWNKLARQGSSSRYTFFAPHNRAFMNVTEQVRATFNSPRLSTHYANSVFSYHTGQYNTFSVLRLTAEQYKHAVEQVSCF